MKLCWLKAFSKSSRDSQDVDCYIREVNFYNMLDFHHIRRCFLSSNN